METSPKEKNILTITKNDVTKQALPLLLHESKWRFNYKTINQNRLIKIAKYIRNIFSINS